MEKNHEEHEETDPPHPNPNPAQASSLFMCRGWISIRRYT